MASFFLPCLVEYTICSFPDECAKEVNNLQYFLSDFSLFLHSVFLELFICVCNILSLFKVFGQFVLVSASLRYSQRKQFLFFLRSRCSSIMLTFSFWLYPHSFQELSVSSYSPKLYYTLFWTDGCNMFPYISKDANYSFGIF